jgi:hypothetical protein
LFQFSNARLLRAGLALFVEETVKLFQSNGLPASDQLWTELMLTADFRLGADPGQKIDDSEKERRVRGMEKSPWMVQY